jgi:phosphoribosylformylglycinamidine (FGAM) synthase PurS component
MTARAVSISLKIPDNTAYTALVALRRLGVDVERVERGEIWLVDDEGDPGALTARITADETIFNPNKHRLTILDACEPRAGEVWIEPLGIGSVEGPHAVAWRLFDAHGGPVAAAVLEGAVERLLCNPAIETARF